MALLNPSKNRKNIEWEKNISFVHKKWNLKRIPNSHAKCNSRKKIPMHPKQYDICYNHIFFHSAVMRYESRAVMRLKGKLNTVHTQIQESAAVGW